MSETPLITARDLLRALRKLGFEETRTRGSHVRLVHPDGRRTTVPVHRVRDIPRGLLHQIVTKDAGMHLRAFCDLL